MIACKISFPNHAKWERKRKFSCWVLLQHCIEERTLLTRISFMCMASNFILGPALLAWGSGTTNFHEIINTVEITARNQCLRYHLIFQDLFEVNSVRFLG